MKIFSVFVYNARKKIINLLLLFNFDFEKLYFYIT